VRNVPSSASPGRGLGVVAEQAVVVPPREMTREVLARSVLAVGRQKRPVEVDPPALADVPRHRQAPALLGPTAAIDARDVLLHAMAADRQLHVHVEHHVVGIAVGHDAHVRSSVRTAIHRRDEPERRERLALERRDHGLGLRLLRHRAMPARMPRGVLARMTASTLLRTDDFARTPIDRLALAVRERAHRAHACDRRPHHRRPEQHRGLACVGHGHSVNVRTSSS
jgi:hypothetical protein